MKLTHATVAVSLLAAAFTATAAEGTEWNPPPSGKTRAEVRAERDRALTSGEIAHGEMYSGLVEAPKARVGVDRADVKSELDRARSSGELAGRNEPYGGGSWTRSRQPT